MSGSADHREAEPKMIVKKMHPTNFSKAKPVMISELADYIFAHYDKLGKEKLALAAIEHIQG